MKVYKLRHKPSGKFIIKPASAYYRLAEGKQAGTIWQKKPPRSWLRKNFPWSYGEVEIVEFELTESKTHAL